jgi:hypothetical protein
MSVSRQIGWSQESNLLYQILKQITKLTSVVFGLKPKYRVYTALLTQSGGDDPLSINTGVLTIGVTYIIYDNSPGMDFTNVGAPNNNLGTYFVATGLNPNNWGEYEGTGTATLVYNSGAPVVTVLENTIGNIWFIFENTGRYFANSNALFTDNKTTVFGGYNNGDSQVYVNYISGNNTNSGIYIQTGDPTASNSYLNNTPIEIRVYN